MVFNQHYEKEGTYVLKEGHGKANEIFNYEMSVSAFELVLFDLWRVSYVV